MSTFSQHTDVNNINNNLLPPKVFLHCDIARLIYLMIIFISDYSENIHVYLAKISEKALCDFPTFT